MRLDRFVQATLAHSARTVRHLLVDQKICVNGAVVTDGRQGITEFCRVEVGDRVLQSREPIYLMLHKPPGCVSATTDGRNPTVLDLIEGPLRQTLHLAGRLDFNSTGLLLLTNDGRWSRRITLPSRKIPKTYRVETKDEITPEYVTTFAAGIYFRFEKLTTSPAELKILSARAAELTIYEGRYHQIKRMFGAFQNEVVGLHRLAMGSITLDENLAPGAYRPLTVAEIASV